MDFSTTFNVAVGCVMASLLKTEEKQEVIDSLRKIEIEIFDERLKPLIEKWKEQTGKQIKCQTEDDDQTYCTDCDRQLFFCECPQLTAQKILELEFGFDDFEEE